MSLGWGAARAAEVCGDFSCCRFSAKRIDVQGVHAGSHRELGSQFSSELDSAAVGDLPVGDVWDQAAGESPRSVGHALVPQQRDASKEPDTGQQVANGFEEGSERIEVEDHLGLDEVRAGSELAPE